MSRIDTPFLFYFVLSLIVLWILFSIAGIGYAAYVAIDAQKDIDARHTIGINSGREILARLVRTMGRLKLFAFCIFFLCGIYAISPWSLNSTGPPWRRMIIPTGLVLGQGAIVLSLINFQRERKRVLDRDTRDALAHKRAEDRARVEAAQQQIESRDALTAATTDLAQATRDQTDALTSGTVAVQIEASPVDKKDMQ